MFKIIPSIIAVAALSSIVACQPGPKTPPPAPETKPIQVKPTPITKEQAAELVETVLTPVTDVKFDTTPKEAIKAVLNVLPEIQNTKFGMGKLQNMDGDLPQQFADFAKSPDDKSWNGIGCAVAIQKNSKGEKAPDLALSIVLGRHAQMGLAIIAPHSKVEAVTATKNSARVTFLQDGKEASRTILEVDNKLGSYSVRVSYLETDLETSSFECGQIKDFKKMEE